MRPSKECMIMPGILCLGTSFYTMHEIDHAVDITIEPEKDSNVTLYFILPKDTAHKKYTITVNFNHAHATLTLLGLYQLSNKNAVEINTTMHHRVPQCSSKQIWKGVMQDSAKATFEGRIIVHPHAQKTLAHLSNKNLLLSKTAEVNTKPILEIEADDVQCTHGATVGCLDQQALFYLRSRGIAENDARQLLIDAFVREITDEIAYEPFKQQVESWVTHYVV